MSNMFKNNTTFNQSLNSWNVSNVTNMSEMFMGATIFNGSIHLWDTTNVIDMTGMFMDATSFNQHLVGYRLSESNGVASWSWDTSGVLYMDRMFKNASSFSSSNARVWTINSGISLNNMFEVSGTSVASSLMDASGTPSINFFNEGYMINTRGYFKDQAINYEEGQGRHRFYFKPNMSGNWIFNMSYKTEYGYLYINGIQVLHINGNNYYKTTTRYLVKDYIYRVEAYHQGVANRLRLDIQDPTGFNTNAIGRRNTSEWLHIEYLPTYAWKDDSVLNLNNTVDALVNGLQNLDGDDLAAIAANTDYVAADAACLKGFSCGAADGTLTVKTGDLVSLFNSSIFQVQK